MEKKASVWEIEVTIISAEDLRLTRKQPVKKNAFIVVRSDPFNSRSTGPDADGGSYPAWNEKLPLHVPCHARFITVEAHSGNRIIGTANVPVSDFAGGFLPENYLSFLSYRLRDSNGQKNGIVNMSVKVMEGAAGRGGAAGGSGQPWEGAAVVGGKISNEGIVTGVPVSYRF